MPYVWITIELGIEIWGNVSHFVKCKEINRQRNTYRITNSTHQSNSLCPR